MPLTMKINVGNADTTIFNFQFLIFHYKRPLREAFYSYTLPRIMRFLAILMGPSCIRLIQARDLPQP